MKFSTNMIIQILMTLMQAYNQISGLLPQKYREAATLIMGVIQAITALLAHYSNPDGTSANLAYKPSGGAVKPLKGICILLPFLFLPGAARAADQGFTLGVAYDQTGAPQILGYGSYDHEIATRLHNESGYTILPVKVEGSIIPHLVFTAFTGVYYDAFAVGKVEFKLRGSGGVSTTGNVTSGTGSIGGFARYPMGKGWSLNAGVDGIYSPITGTNANIRIGFRFGG